MNTSATWIQELQRLRTEHGWPSSRELAKLSGLSHTHVNDILRGYKYQVSKKSFLKLLHALTNDKQERSRITALFDDDHPGTSARKRPAADWHDDVSPDMRMLCETLLQTARILAGHHPSDDTPRPQHNDQPHEPQAT